MPNLPNNNQDPLLDQIRQRLSFAEKEAVGKYHIHVNDQTRYTGGSATTFATAATLTLGKVEGATNFHQQVTQALNRFINQATRSTSSSQLIHLETGTSGDVKNILTTEAAAYSHPLSGVTGDRRRLIKYAPIIRQQLLTNTLTSENSALLARLLQANGNNVAELAKLITTEGVNGRFNLHEAKTAARLRQHLSNVAANIKSNSPSALSREVTEARGEYAATKIILTLFGSPQFQQIVGTAGALQLKIGKAAQGSQNGIDQIWVERDMATGDIKRYFIVEAKGNKDATVGFTQQTGYQMSFRWLFYALVMMWRGDGRYMDQTSPNQSRTAKKILDAMFDDQKRIKVVGLKVKSLFGGGTQFNSIVELTYYGEYNAPEVLQDIIIEEAASLVLKSTPLTQAELGTVIAAIIYLRQAQQIEEARRRQQAVEGIVAILANDPQLLQMFVSLVQALLTPPPPQPFMFMPQQQQVPWPSMQAPTGYGFAPPQPVRLTAQVTFISDRGFGFARDPISGESFFIHASEFIDARELPYVTIGRWVTFTPDTTHRQGQRARRARQIQLV
ncbi:MAG TPA: hypothetical protein VF342_09495 [Alphaproteobacteria bacterium]